MQSVSRYCAVIGSGNDAKHWGVSAAREWKIGWSLSNTDSVPDDYRRGILAYCATEPGSQIGLCGITERSGWHGKQ